MVKQRIVFIIIGILLIVAAGVLTVCLVNGTNSVQSGAVPISGSSDSLVGSWHGSKSLFFGMAEADFTLTAREDGTMTIVGTVNAPVADIVNQPFSVDSTWTHSSGTTYIGTIGKNSQEFNCDGSQISLTVNPYAAGMIDNEMVNMDIDLTLTRQ